MKNLIQIHLKMDKYAQIKRFYYECTIQVRICDFMQVHPEKMAKEDYFTDTKTFVANYKKMSTPGLVPKHWLGSSYICSEYYEFDLNFDVIKIRSKSDQSSNNKAKLFCENILVIEE